MASTFRALRGLREVDRDRATRSSGTSGGGQPTDLRGAAVPWRVVSGTARAGRQQGASSGKQHGDADAVTTSGGHSLTSRPSRLGSDAAPIAASNAILRSLGSSARPSSNPGHAMVTPELSADAIERSSAELDSWTHGDTVQRTALLRRLTGRSGARVA